MIPRLIANKLKTLFEQYPVVLLTGPRQSGKTTLCRTLYKELPYFNLERPDIREFAESDPLQFLAQNKNGMVIDEIQRLPKLLSYIQADVDEKQSNKLYLLTGSQNIMLLQSTSQSLAGRVAILQLLPFSLPELRDNYSFNSDALLFKGGYPRIYDQDLDPFQALADYTTTYLERDVRQISNLKDLSGFQRFLRLCAGRVGQLLNISNLSNDTGVSHTTIREWLSILETSYIIFRLQPFHSNIRKRLTRSPKIYFYDTGLATHLLGLEQQSHLNNHPLRGNLFENFVISEIVKHRINSAKPANIYFFRDSKGHEIDCLYPSNGTHVPIEVKSALTIAPVLFKNLNYYENLFGEKIAKGLVYGGLEDRIQTGISIIPWNKIDGWLNSIEK